MQRVRCHSVLCSMIFLSVKNMIDTTRFSPETCLFLTEFKATASDRHFMMTFAKILLGVDNNVMPRQLLHSDRAPFFWYLNNDTLVPVIRDFPSVPYGVEKWLLVVVTASALNSSPQRRSLPGALWFLRELMAVMISSFFRGLMSTLKSSSASGIQAPLLVLVY